MPTGTKKQKPRLEYLESGVKAMLKRSSGNFFCRKDGFVSYQKPLRLRRREIVVRRTRIRLTPFPRRCKYSSLKAGQVIGRSPDSSFPPRLVFPEVNPVTDERCPRLQWRGRAYTKPVSRYCVPEARGLLPNHCFIPMTLYSVVITIIALP